MGFADLATVKECLGIPDTTTKHDAAIQKAVTRANAAVLRYLCLDQCDPKQYELSADVWCDDRPVDSLCVAPQPLISIDEVKSKGCILDPSRYRCRGSYLLLCSGAFCCGCGCNGEPSVEATVTAGFDLSRADHQLMFDVLSGGTVDYAIALFKSPGGGGLKTEKNGRFSYTRFSALEQAGNGPIGWPTSLSTAVSDYYRPETGNCLTVAC